MFSGSPIGGIRLDGFFPNFVVLSLLNLVLNSYGWCLELLEDLCRCERIGLLPLGFA